MRSGSYAADSPAELAVRPQLTPRFITMVVLATVVLAGGILLARHTLAQSLTALTRLNWAWFLAGLGFEAGAGCCAPTGTGPGSAR